MNKLAEMTLKSDPQLIKNPFICGSSAPIRTHLDKMAKMKKGDTTYVKQYEMTDGSVRLNNELDNRLSYTFQPKEIPVDTYKQEYTSGINMDYQVPADVLNNNRTDGKTPHIDGVKLSFIQIKNEADGIEWYRIHYPKIPQDLLPIIARYHWGEPISKKGIKNEKKKIVKDLGRKGLTIKQEKVVVKFD